MIQSDEQLTATPEALKTKSSRFSVEAAPLKVRTLAFMIDLLILLGILVTIWPIVITHYRPSITMWLVITAAAILLYELLFETSMAGQTPGRRLFRIRVAQLDGSPAKFGQYLRRVTLMIVYCSAVAVGGYWLGLIGATIATVIYLIACFLKVWRGFTGTVVIKSERKGAKELTEPDASDKPAPPPSLISNIAQVSQNARSIYLLYIGFLAYCALTVFGTSDRRIILNESARLPIINLDVSLDGFFILAPILAVFVFIYLQLYLSKLQRLFDALRTRYAPIREDEEIYPWMLNFVGELRTGLVARLQRFIVDFSIWWSMPMVLMVLAAWYLKKHDPVLGSVVGIMPLVGAFAVVLFWRGQEALAGPRAQSHVWPYILFGLVLLFEVYLFCFFMPRALRGERLIGAWPAVDLSHQNLVNKEDGGTFWVNLRDARLQGADFTGAILEKADLRQANLEGAKLEEADLRQADLTGANLRGANLMNARFDSTTDLSALRWNLNILRTMPDTSLSVEAVRTMLVQKGHYDRFLNRSANGYPNRFGSQKDGTLLYDGFSGLTWQQSGSSTARNYQEALAYIDTLKLREYGGYDDWRLPTLEEAMSLMEPVRNEELLFIDPIFDRAQIWIWTSDKESASLAWYVHFNYGSCILNHVNDSLFVRAVR